MTSSRVAIDDRRKLSAEQTSTYTRYESQLRRQLLKGVLDTEAVLAGLQELTQMTIGSFSCNGQPEIPGWAKQEKPIIQHLPCGWVNPSKFALTDVLKDGEKVIDGDDFLLRAQAVPGSMNACAFDFYAKEQNWKYLPRNVEVVVFPNTVFCHWDGDRHVACLFRKGVEWERVPHCLKSKVDREFLVASFVNPEPLEARVS
ncbi:MAG: hypothetical protein V4467_03370 [Patescibacteria group bacterium]